MNGFPLLQARYSRLPDWNYISECSKVARDSGIPLIGNGDVLSWEDFEEHRKGGVSACMLGRGALIKPWVFKEIKEK
jgi:tRNA-dihydrouridine synthase 3